MSKTSREWLAISLYLTAVLIGGAIDQTRKWAIGMAWFGILILLLNGNAVTRLQGAVAKFGAPQ